MQGEDVLIVVLALVIYFLPVIIAAQRKHHQTLAIAVTVILIGWTGLGWAVALIWSVTATQGKWGKHVG